jgi:hypothetical protein
MLSALISVSFYGILVQRVVFLNTCKSQQKYNSNIENSLLNFECLIHIIQNERLFMRQELMAF